VGSSGLPAPVLFGSSTLLWIFTPLCQTVIRAFFSFVPSEAQRGDVNLMSYVCHTSGGRHMFTSGGRNRYSPPLPLLRGSNAKESRTWTS